MFRRWGVLRIMSLAQMMKTAAAYGKDPQLSCTFGELTVYDPITNTGKFLLVVHPDADTLQPYEIGPLQCPALFTGANGAGAQFPPAVGDQALLVYIDLERQYPIVVSWLNNDYEPPPFPNGTTYGWSDPSGNQITTSTANGGNANVLAANVELGATGLDTSLDAVITVRHFNDWVENYFTPHVHSGVQGGPDDSGPPTSTGNSAGSSTVRAQP